MARWVVAVYVVMVLAACTREPPPPYVRLTGAAPSLDGIPASATTLVVFWATWCAPCREETPSLRRLAETRPPGLEFVVFSQDSSMDPVTAFLGEPSPVNWNLRLDQDRKALEAFRVDKLPVSFLVVQGRLVARFAGTRDWASRGMRGLLHRLMTEAGAGAP